MWKPVATSRPSEMSRTESFKPPVACTTGRVPYTCAYICGKPQGSYREGMMNKSQPAIIWCSTLGSKPTKPQTRPPYWPSAHRNAFAYFSSPLPIMMSCTRPVTPLPVSSINQPMQSAKTSTPFCHVKRPQKPTTRTSGSCLRPSRFCSSALLKHLPSSKSASEKVLAILVSMAGFQQSSTPLRMPASRKPLALPLTMSSRPKPPSLVWISQA
mmetsp:Transcript_51201/g.165875  ORF Transcript_51201/g.165875 Transcript_51201/m.165875 type:complete len:213 (-) Transcript_51201:1477-2115(-)